MEVLDSVPRRRSPLRLRGFDYAQPGAYFVTMCTHKRVSLLGEVVDGIMHLSLEGGVVTECWEAIGEHSETARPDILGVMPNHMHGILWLLGIPSTADSPDPVGATHASPLHRLGRHPGPEQSSLGAIIGSFKSAAARRINELRDTPGAPVWQRGFYEHVIRTDTDLDRIRRYIEANPSCWPSDEENPECLSR